MHNERVKQMLRQMRDLIQSLRGENAQLKKENQRLQRLVHELSGGLDQWTDVGMPDQGEDVMWIAELEEFMSESALVQNTTPQRAILRRQAQPPSSTTPSSTLMGRGLSPEQSERRGLQPQSQMPRPNIDIGYVNDVSAKELDRLPYGLIILNRAGDVLFYNETESQLAGFARESVVGKNFFQDVAPCTRVKAFMGRFEQFVRGELGRVTFFDFVFHFEHGAQNVVIGLSHGREKGHFNVMLVRQAG